MKAKIAFGLAGLMVLLSGCTTYRGGTVDDVDYDTGYDSDTPAASPTFRPGLYPNDIRDSSTLDHPIQPHGPP